jgi:glycosyltransferase involved in cell wall biosynthesis
MANHDNGRFIGEAIESVRRQTFKEWELVIVDDASTDDSLAVIYKYLSDGRIKLVRNEQNEGCGAAKKKCAENATGIILGEMDADDALADNAFEELDRFYSGYPDFDFVCTSHYECDESLRIRRKNSWIKSYDPSMTNLLDPMVSHFKTFRRSSYLKTAGYDPGYKKAVDKDIIYKLEEVAKVGFIDKPLYYYRRHDKGISTGKNAWQARLWDNMAKYAAYQRRIGTAIPNLSESQIRDLLCDGIWRSLFLQDKEKMAYFFRESKKNGAGYCDILLFPLRFLKKNFGKFYATGDIYPDGQL